MTDQKSPLEHVLDLVFYVPVGLVITAREQLPRLAEKGRQRINGQVTMARLIGQFAVSQGQREASKVGRQAMEALVVLGVIPRDGRPTGHRPPSSTTERSQRAANNGSACGDADVPSSAGLAIPGYDSLSASQVVQRLGGLAPEELEAVRLYEMATRGRRTILSKIAQLQSSQS